MSKAKEFAYSKYPKDNKGVLYDLARNSIIQGYHQAEKDLELTWEDVEKIYELVIKTDNEYLEANADNDYEYDVKEMYQEVLKRFREMKNNL